MDNVAEFLTRIRNAGLAKHEKVDMPSSSLRVGIATILQKTGYIRSFKVARDNRQGMMRVYLRYSENGSHMIQNLERISRPGLRKYIAARDVPTVRNGYGLAVLSTSQGVMDSEQAKTKNVGGELLFQVW